MFMHTSNLKLSTIRHDHKSKKLEMQYGNMSLKISMRCVSVRTFPKFKVTQRVNDPLAVHHSDVRANLTNAVKNHRVDQR